MQRQQAPFRADIVGSFLRPDSIKQARQQLAEGLIDAGQLRDIENNAIRHLVQQQCDCGLHVVTDGEFRRAWWHFDFFDGLQGVERYDAEQGIQFNGVQTKAHGVRVTGKLAFGDHPMLEDFRYLKSISGDAQPKMTIPSPSVLHFRGGRKDIDATVYPDLSDYFDDLATTWRDAIRAFYDAGCRYLQLDDTVWAYLCSDAQRQQVRERKMTIPSPSVLHFRGGRKDIDATVYPDLSDYFDDLATTWRDAIRAFYDAGCRYLQLDDTVWAYLCSDAQRQQVRERGDDPDALARIYARVLNQALEGKPADLTVGLHVCRGNFRSTWISEGGYEPVAEVLFGGVNVDAFFLEYDNDRSGDFAPLRFIRPGHQQVVLGLITTKNGELENPQG
ncbi:5-methyltetrahydropteroyltriglutamate--homocysteine S-methyltransferase, partial [Klebsiella quasipneumoniae subsp. similipneumoniae]|uniref:5-methyltetrahydropteroyltriglutamate-- homocysteine S-methyltransferase n=3 Tax=Klebsiella quasipneumoniae TaxID=1463165 RepID=UPI0039672C10